MRIKWSAASTLILLVAIFSSVAQLAVGQTASSLSLEQAVHLGLIHDPLIRGAEADAARARAALAESRAQALPSVSASEEAIIADDPVFAFGTKLRQARFAASDLSLPVLNHPSAIGAFDSSVSVNWVAYDFAATRKRIHSAKDAARAADLNRDFTSEQVVARIIQLYYRALLAQSQVPTAQSNLTRAREIASDIRDRVHAGLALEADGMRADLAVRNAENDLAASQANASVARADLFGFMDQPDTNAALVAPDLQALSSVSEPKSADMSARFDMQAFDLQKASAQQRLSAVRASGGPELSMFAGVDSNNPHFSGGGSGNWTVGAKLEISVFDGGARKAREEDAAAQLAKITAQKEEAEREASKNIRALHAKMEDLRRRYATASDATTTNEEALKVSRDRYAAGLVPVSEVLNGESDLTAAEFAKLRSLYELCIAHSDLEFATGTLSISKTGQP